MPIPALLQAKRPPDWIERNWKWVVPVLSLVAILCVGGFLMLIFGLIKSSDAYLVAVERARSAPAVVDALGTPMTEGFYVTGNISVNGPSGRAELAIPISGPKAGATIYVSATKSLGKWHFPGLVVQVDRTNQRIDLSEHEK